MTAQQAREITADEFYDTVMEMSNEEDYNKEHFLLYQGLVESSWQEAYEQYNEINDVLNNFVGNSSVDLKRFLSGRETDILDKAERMDKYMDLAVDHELNPERDYSDVDLDSVDKMLNLMSEEGVESYSDFKDTVRRLDSSQESFNDPEEVFLIDAFVQTFWRTQGWK